MTPGTVTLLITGAGAIASLALLIAAVRRGRQKPERPIPWVIALVITGLPALGIAATAILTLGSKDVQGMWMVAGAIALCLMVAVTVVRPRWAAWAYLVSALVMPALAAFGDLVTDEPSQVEAVNVIAFYTIRSLIAAGLLFWATGPAAAAPAPSSSSPGAGA